MAIMKHDAVSFISSLKEKLNTIAECVFPGIVYGRADADNAIKIFPRRKS
jgi:hypothetical protein